jgi:hypothetical protein
VPAALSAKKFAIPAQIHFPRRFMYLHIGLTNFNEACAQCERNDNKKLKVDVACLILLFCGGDDGTEKVCVCAGG